jgi:hypothetical protein
MPRHKGKVEAGVKYSQNNAVKGRSFTSLAEQNQFLSDWERTVADTRIHGTTRQQVIKVFNEVERAKLLPLPSSLFPVFEEAPRSVHRAFNYPQVLVKNEDSLRIKCTNLATCGG